MSNSKKFQISAAKLVLLGLLYGVILTFIFKMQSNNELPVNYEVIFLVSSIGAVILAFIIDRVLRIVVSCFTLKFDYFIVDETDKEIHSVIKFSGKDTLLVQTGEIVEFVTDIKRKRYKKKFRENVKLEKFYGSKYPKILLFVLPICLVLAGFVDFKAHIFIKLLLYMIFLFVIFIFVGLVYGYFDNKRIKKELENINQEEVGNKNQKGSGSSGGSESG